MNRLDLSFNSRTENKKCKYFSIFKKPPFPSRYHLGVYTTSAREREGGGGWLHVLMSIHNLCFRAKENERGSSTGRERK